jgi:hypothetical protein
MTRHFINMIYQYYYTGNRINWTHTLAITNNCGNLAGIHTPKFFVITAHINVLCV